MRRPLIVVLPLLVCASCGDNAMHDIDPDLNRMVVQPRVDPYGASEFFADGVAMRHPAAGTVAREAVLGPVAEAEIDGHYRQRLPLPVNRALLHDGQRAFRIRCAPCHGLLGDGQSFVAEQMRLVKPRNLLTAPVRSYPPGRIFAVISAGYGMMPSYAKHLTPRQRWAVVAYLQALQLSQAYAIDDLPAELRRQLDEEAP